MATDGRTPTPLTEPLADPVAFKVAQQLFREARRAYAYVPPGERPERVVEEQAAEE